MVTENDVHCVIWYFYAEDDSSRWPWHVLIYFIEVFTLNTLRPRQDGCHFAEDIFKCILLNENVWISINFSLKFILRVPIDNITALLQIIAWRRAGNKPLSEPMMASFPTQICVTRPQWVKLGDFLKNGILLSNDVQIKCNTCMKLVQYNEYLISIVDTAGLVL